MKIKTDNYIINFIEEYSDNLYQFEVESKGYFYGVTVVLNNGKTYQLSIYNSTRLKQDVDDEIENTGFFYEENIVFLKNIDKDTIIEGVKKLWEHNCFENMVEFEVKN